MNMTFNTSTANPYIVSLARAFSNADSPVKWLVIADDNAEVAKSLPDALDGESAAVLELPQEQWDFGSQQLAEAIEWAFDHSSIENIVLVGCSQWETDQDAVTDDGDATGYDRLLAGVQRTSARNRETQTRFASQVQQLSAMNVVCQMGNALTVSGLFYRSEDGVLLAYESSQDCFRPLLALA